MRGLINDSFSEVKPRGTRVATPAFPSNVLNLHLCPAAFFPFRHSLQHTNSLERNQENHINLLFRPPSTNTTMRFSLAALILVVSPLLATASPPQVREAADQLRLRFTDENDDKCPDLKVRCFKDGDLTQPIGNIGKQSYCWDEEETKCKQCHQTKNNVQCNTKYLKDCATKCEAIGTPL
ncbi:BQ5605_C023g09675 [Microbotryum silenes-dioicae]|uniref:BQ5605_C023g09675 protein n=1 Tax=Microbotryum silenes-dioicae TaxID=796604 RepID=A0A2X0N7F7_9BASI|nr:BQ5605_C023g09675 [Microbotryum silenes-dioicae]